MMNPAPNICYTIALDMPGDESHRKMARLLVTSLLRTRWRGRIVVFRNGPKAVLPEGHPEVEEVLIDAAPSRVWDETMTWKFRAGRLLDVTGFSKVLFLDCDCIALRDISGLMAGGWDLYTAPEPGRMTERPFNGYLTDPEMISLWDRPGINAGVLGIRACRFAEVMEEWAGIDRRPQLRPFKGRDQHAWNRLILDTSLRHRPFAAGEVQFPFLHRAHYGDYRRAALIHAADRPPEEKLSLLYGLWMEAHGTGAFEEITAPASPSGA